MSVFFFEILSEEVPARLQPIARKISKEFWEKKLRDRKIPFDSVHIDTTPRRLIGIIEGLPATLSETKEVLKGPRVDAPEASLQGFLKTQGIASIQECGVLETAKGAFWSYEKITPPEKTSQLMSFLLEEMVGSFPWPKSMRWDGTPLKWVRPIRGLVALFDGQVIPATIGFGVNKISSGRTTRGHRYFGSVELELSSHENYAQKLKDGGVIINVAHRQAFIQKDLEALAQKEELEVDWDLGLLEEVTGLVECPLIIRGTIDKEFMHLPPKLLKTVMRVHQRYFALQDPKTKGCASSFLLVADRPVKEEQETIRLGNENVLQARLRDAQFFFDQDSRMPLDHHGGALKERHFFGELGSVYDKALRLEDYAKNGFLECLVGEGKVSPELVEFGARAGFLAKADLSSQMVREFPELQGYMGGIYAAYHKEPPEVSQAIEYQYDLPTHEDSFGPIASFVGIADRLDTLVGFFALGMLPTGSRDPYALRRAALGIITLLKFLKTPVPLDHLVSLVMQTYAQQTSALAVKMTEDVKGQVLAFLKERLIGELRHAGYPIGVIEGVVASHWYNHIPAIFATVETLGQFLATPKGQATFALYKRVDSIVDKTLMEGANGVEEERLIHSEEKLLWQELHRVKTALKEPVSLEEKLELLGSLKNPFDLFFEKILVNDNDPTVRLNRQALLRGARALFEGTYFGQIETLS